MFLVDGIAETVHGLTIFCAAKLSLRCYNLCWGLGKIWKHMPVTRHCCGWNEKTYDRFLAFILHMLKCCLDDDSCTCLVNMMIMGGLRKVPVFCKKTIYWMNMIMMRHVAWEPFYWHGFTWITAWISNYMPSKVWDEITYPSANFSSATTEACS